MICLPRVVGSVAFLADVTDGCVVSYCLRSDSVVARVLLCVSFSCCLRDVLTLGFDLLMRLASVTESRQRPTLDTGLSKAVALHLSVE